MKLSQKSSTPHFSETQCSLFFSTTWLIREIPRIHTSIHRRLYLITYTTVYIKYGRYGTCRYFDWQATAVATWYDVNRRYTECTSIVQATCNWYKQNLIWPAWTCLWWYGNEYNVDWPHLPQYKCHRLLCVIRPPDTCRRQLVDPAGGGVP